MKIGEAFSTKTFLQINMELMEFEKLLQRVNASSSFQELEPIAQKLRDDGMDNLILGNDLEMAKNSLHDLINDQINAFLPEQL